jgi:hypothetical protein
MWATEAVSRHPAQAPLLGCEILKLTDGYCGTAATFASPWMGETTSRRAGRVRTGPAARPDRGTSAEHNPRSRSLSAPAGTTAKGAAGCSRSGIRSTLESAGCWKCRVRRCQLQADAASPCSFPRSRSVKSRTSRGVLWKLVTRAGGASRLALLAGPGCRRLTTGRSASRLRHDIEVSRGDISIHNSDESRPAFGLCGCTGRR